MGVLHIWHGALSQGKQGGFGQALKYLESQEIILESSTSYFNLGVLASAINELPLAKYYFYKSFLVNFFNIDAYSKLTLVNTLLEKTTQVSDDFLVQFFLLLKSGIFLSLFLVSVILFLLICFIRGSKKFKEKHVLIGTFIFLLFFTIFPKLIEIGMVREDAIQHVGPSTIFKTEKMTRAGKIFFLGNTNNKFTKVYGVNENSVWLYRDKIERL